MALGAQQQNVLWMILRDSSMLAIVGVVVGGPAALASARLVSSKLYGVAAPEDASTLTISAVILLAAGVLAGYLPARRAARLDPMTALREE
jgi:ABC-type antimicrobial peptide transport system permease subunit